jgi:hypothetical protein
MWPQADHTAIERPGTALMRAGAVPDVPAAGDA